MAYPHKDEMVWLAVRWWWFLGAQNGGSSCSSPTAAPSRPLCSWKRSRLSEVLRSAATRVLNTRTSLVQSIRKMGRSGLASELCAGREGPHRPNFPGSKKPFD